MTSAAADELRSPPSLRDLPVSPDSAGDDCIPFPNSVFLPASDIPRFVALGSVSLGITGQDVIVESALDHLITELLPLEFGKCALQVQVPVNSGFQTLDELAGKRIATSFEVMAGKLFKEVDERAKADRPTEVEYVGGSVEAACALGVADGIVDLVGQSPALPGKLPASFFTADAFPACFSQSQATRCALPACTRSTRS